MKRLHILILKELAAPFLISFSLLTLFLTIAQIIGISDTLLEISLEFKYFLKIFLITIPSSLLFALPMTTLITTFMAIIRLAKDNEVISLLATGISPTKTLFPIFIFSLLMSLSSLYVSVHLYPNSVKEVRELIRALSENILSRGLPDKIFITPIPNITFFISESLNEGKTFNGIFIRDSRDSENTVNIYASKGELKNDPKTGISSLNLTDGVVIKRDWKKQEIDVIKFNNYDMKITRQTKPIKESRGEMDIFKLWEKANDRGISQSKRNIYLSEFHKRLSIPVGTLLLGLIAMPIAYLLGKTTITGGIGIGTMVFLFYYITLVLFSNLADSGKINVIIALWTPNLVLFLLFLILIWGLNTNFKPFSKISIK